MCVAYLQYKQKRYQIPLCSVKGPFLFFPSTGNSRTCDKPHQLRYRHCAKFSLPSIICGTGLMTALSMVHEKKQIETLEKMGMNLIKKLNGNPKQRKTPAKLTPNQVAHQLLLHGKFNSKNQYQTPNANRKHQLSQTSYYKRAEHWYKYHE